MKVYLQTSVTPEIEVYDSNSEGKPGGPLSTLLKPVVLVKDDSGRLLYVYGTPGSSWLSDVPSFLLLGLAVWVGSIILRRF